MQTLQTPSIVADVIAFGAKGAAVVFLLSVSLGPAHAQTQEQVPEWAELQTPGAHGVDTVAAHGRELAIADVDAILGDAPGARDGLFMQTLVGPAVTHLSAVGRSGAASVRALGLGIGLRGGGWISHNVVLTAEAGASTALDPRLQGSALAQPTGAVTLTTISAGAGVTYVLDQGLGKLSAAFLCTQLRLVDRVTGFLISGTGFGPGLELGVSRDWWLLGEEARGDDGANFDWSPGWRLGAALRTSVSRQSDMARALSYTTVAAVAAVSISYE